MIRNLFNFFQSHLCPSAPLSLGVMISGFLLYLAGLFSLDLSMVVLGLSTFFLPVVLWMVIEYFHLDPESACLGYFFCYEITDRNLLFKLFRVVPVLMIRVSSIQRIEPRRTADKGLHKLNFFSFLTGRIWYWPVPFQMLPRMFSGVGHERWNYSLRLASGWTVVLVAPHEFISEIGRRLRRSPYSRA